MFTKGHHEDAVQLLKSIAEVNRKEPVNLSDESLKGAYDFWMRNHRNMKLCCSQNNSSSRNDLLKSEKLRCYSCRKRFSIIMNILW
jgi:hypothetical protein